MLQTVLAPSLAFPHGRWSWAPSHSAVRAANHVRLVQMLVCLRRREPCMQASKRTSCLSAIRVLSWGYFHMRLLVGFSMLQQMPRLESVEHAVHMKSTRWFALTNSGAVNARERGKASYVMLVAQGGVGPRLVVFPELARMSRKGGPNAPRRGLAGRASP